MNQSPYLRDRKSILFHLYDHPHGTNIRTSAGGVVIVGGQGKIEINNTFEERLRLLEIDALPVVRETLFGKNENRRFYD